MRAFAWELSSDCSELQHQRKAKPRDTVSWQEISLLVCSACLCGLEGGTDEGIHPSWLCQLWEHADGAGQS